MHNEDPIIKWLLMGDVSIQYQVFRDLLAEERPDLQRRISSEGWGAIYLDKRHADGHWGRRFYQPKWISSHYTLLDLRNLCISAEIQPIRNSIQLILDTEKGKDGGVNPSGTISQSDVCINGMFLDYATYFGMKQEDLKSVVDFILSQRLTDGGFNCRFNRSGARHSSLHSTLSVAEGILGYVRQGFSYRLAEMKEAEATSREFMLKHELFRSDKTGKTIDPNYLRFPYPSRWKYDILRALDYLQASEKGFDPRLSPAIEVLIGKRKKDGIWVLPAKHPGQTHLEMEKPGQASRWNTLRALRVLRHFGTVQF